MCWERSINSKAVGHKLHDCLQDTYSLPKRGRAAAQKRASSLSLPFGFFNVIILIFEYQVNSSPCPHALPRPPRTWEALRCLRAALSCLLPIALTVQDSCNQLLLTSAVKEAQYSGAECLPLTWTCSRASVHRQACGWWWLESAQCWVSLAHHDDHILSLLWNMPDMWLYRNLSKGSNSPTSTCLQVKYY